MNHRQPADVAEHIHVDGIVQGVGFRPFVYRLARQLGLRGWVRNSSRGVDVHVIGAREAIEAFVEALRREPPPLAVVARVQRQPLPRHALADAHDFRIVPSRDEGGFTLVSPDVATCPDCLRELFDPRDRRYRYPFINCTHCGPRFSIVRSLPYDRAHTTMARFPMCPACAAEYHDPADRRFHAQPNACPACGPRVRLEVKRGWRARLPRAAEDDIARTAALLRAGAVLAIKGLGGFHLACDATNRAAIARLRARKRRPHKPFAVMMRDLAMVRRYCRVSAEAEALLTSPQAPIVLLPLRSDAALPADALAPGLDALGVMLPYTPLHHLLLHDAAAPLVMTSGNRGGEPMARTHADARRQLRRLVDGFLWHDRPIHNRVDDSVWQVSGVGAFPVRRSRGAVPQPIVLAEASPAAVLALGSEMKNTFCLLTGAHAFLGQHIGEMRHAATWQFFWESVARFRQLFGVQPAVIAHDMHPDFTLAAETALADMPALAGLPRVAVQHHHAHLAALLAEHGHTAPALGLTLDGTGYGADGTVWGGEVLLAEGAAYRRLASLRLFPLPGNEAAILQPLRIAVALSAQVAGEDRVAEAVGERLSEAERRAVLWQAARGVNTPQASSCGRLFDALAAWLGLVDTVTYEGQAAMLLEVAARQAAPLDAVPPYPVVWQAVSEGGAQAPAWRLDWAPMWAGVLADTRARQPAPWVAARFHAWWVAALVDVLARLRRETGVGTVGLSGGCFVNRLLLETLVPRLRAQGWQVLLPRRVPPTDGGIALGQAWVAARALARSRVE